MKLLTVSAVALVLCCCGHAEPSVCTDIPTRPAQDAFGVGLDCKNPTIEVDRTARGAAMSCETDPDCAGRTLQDGFYEFPKRDHWVYVKDGIDHPEITLAHELGHLLGAAHSDDECDIMYPHATECRTERYAVDY